MLRGDFDHLKRSQQPFNVDAYQVERIVDQLLLLFRVHRGEAGSGRGRGATPRIRDVRRNLPALQEVEQSLIRCAVSTVSFQRSATYMESGRVISAQRQTQELLAVN